MPGKATHQEIEAAQAMRDSGSTIKTIAEKMGRSARWVMMNTSTASASEDNSTDQPSEPVANPIERAAEVVRPVVDAVRSAVQPAPDLRVKAWISYLEARAQDELPPRWSRVHSLDKITGSSRIAQVKALMIVGKSARDAAEAVVKAAMEEHQGEKHCDW